MFQAVADAAGTPNSFDLIIGSEVAYSVDAVEPLFQTVAALLKDSDTDSASPDSRFVMSYTPRFAAVDAAVVECAARYGLEEESRVPGATLAIPKRDAAPAAAAAAAEEEQDNRTQVANILR